MANECAASPPSDSFGKWISMQERKPEKGQFFLAFGEHIGPHLTGPSMDICLLDGDIWVENGLILAQRNQRVTHWMPLPPEPTNA